MKNSIEELYYGNLEPQESQTYINKKLRRELKKLCDKEENLRSKLSVEQLKLFEEYYDVNSKFTGISCTDSFISGFKLGAKLTYDTFVE